MSVVVLERKRKNSIFVVRYFKSYSLIISIIAYIILLTDAYQIGKALQQKEERVKSYFCGDKVFKHQ